VVGWCGVTLVKGEVGGGAGGQKGEVGVVGERVMRVL